MGEGLKLYVWSGVLRDYSAGVAYALASSAEEAKAMLLATGIDKHHWDGIRLDGQEPVEHSEPTAGYLYGGG